MKFPITTWKDGDFYIAECKWLRIFAIGDSRDEAEESVITQIRWQAERRGLEPLAELLNTRMNGGPWTKDIVVNM